MAQVVGHLQRVDHLPLLLLLGLLLPGLFLAHHVENAHQVVDGVVLCH